MTVAPAAVRRRANAFCCCVVLAVALIATAPVAAQFVSIPLGGPHPVKPSPNRTQLGAPADIAGALAVRARPAAMRRLDEVRRPAEVLAFLGLSNGARVLVVEADSGYYSEIIGTAVGPGGHVATLVPSAERRDPARRAALADLIARVPGLSVEAEDSADRLPRDSVDFVLLHLVYHALHARGAGEVAAYLQNIFTALRPGGIVGVVDYAALPGSDAHAAAGLGRIDEAAVLSDFRRAGFVLDDEATLLRNTADDRSQAVAALDDPGHADRFVLRFRKPD